MRIVSVAFFSLLALGACSPVSVIGTPDGEISLNRTVVPQTSESPTIARFRAVVARVEPVAEQACRTQTRGLNCDFNIVLDTRPNLQPNAFQTLDERDRPIIGFTLSLIEEMRNSDELAFALAHEAAHHIENHIPQTQTSAVTGALIGSVLGTIAGLDAAGVESAQRIGGNVGARQFSKDFELEADAMGARIAAQAGYDPVRGVQYFQRAPDPGDRFLGTHPPNAQRIQVVRDVAASL